jgi:hypothetical protein
VPPAAKSSTSVLAAPRMEELRICVAARQFSEHGSIAEIQKQNVFASAATERKRFWAEAAVRALPASTP